MNHVPAVRNTPPESACAPHVVSLVRTCCKHRSHGTASAISTFAALPQRRERESQDLATHLAQKEGGHKLLQHIKHASAHRVVAGRLAFAGRWEGAERHDANAVVARRRPGHPILAEVLSAQERWRTALARVAGSLLTVSYLKGIVALPVEIAIRSERCCEPV